MEVQPLLGTLRASIEGLLGTLTVPSFPAETTTSLRQQSLRGAQSTQDFRLFVAATLDNIQAPRVVNAAPNARKANSLVSRGDINPSSNDGLATTLACAAPQRGFRGRNGTLGRLRNEQGRKRKSHEGTTYR